MTMLFRAISGPVRGFHVDAMVYRVEGGNFEVEYTPCCKTHMGQSYTRRYASLEELIGILGDAELLHDGQPVTAVVNRNDDDEVAEIYLAVDGTHRISISPSGLITEMCKTKAGWQPCE